MATHREWIMYKTRKFQIIYASPTNLCQHPTTDLSRGIMMNERKQSVLMQSVLMLMQSVQLDTFGVEEVIFVLVTNIDTI